MIDLITLAAVIFIIGGILSGFASYSYTVKMTKAGTEESRFKYTKSFFNSAFITLLCYFLAAALIAKSEIFSWPAFFVITILLIIAIVMNVWRQKQFIKQRNQKT